MRAKRDHEVTQFHKEMEYDKLVNRNAMQICRDSSRAATLTCSGAVEDVDTNLKRSGSSRVVSEAVIDSGSFL